MQFSVTPELSPGGWGSVLCRLAENVFLFGVWPGVLDCWEVTA